MTRRIAENRTSAPSQSHTLSGCDTSQPDPGGFAGIHVEIVRRDGEDWPAGDEPRNNLLSWQYVNGALVYDETPRTFFPHSAAAVQRIDAAEGAGTSLAAPAPGPDTDPSGPGVSPAGGAS